MEIRSSVDGGETGGLSGSRAFTRLYQGLGHWVGSLIDLIILERNLIVRALRLQAAQNSMTVFSQSLRYLFFVNAHVWGFWALGKGRPSGTSYLIFFAAGFCTYQIYGAGRRSAPTAALNISSMSLNVKWLHLFTANLSLETLKILLGFVVLFIFYSVFPVPFIGHQFVFPNLPLLLACFAIAAGIGVGFGLMMQTALRLVPALHSLEETLYWVVFLTSGVYMPLAAYPARFAYYYSFSPMLTAIEYSRHALDDTYPVNGLNLAYAAAVAAFMVFVGLACRRVEVERLRWTP